jgi:hypothetical protein
MLNPSLVFGHIMKTLKQENKMAKNRHIKIHWREWHHYLIWRLKKMLKPKRFVA